jgi:sarcosine oxidase gamma subunit
MPMSRRDRGQAAVMVMITASVVFVTVLWALGALGDRLVDHARARTAADAAALASLQGGRPAALAIAHHHGAVVVAWSAGPGPDEVTVVVSFGGAEATARATQAVTTLVETGP